MSKWYDKEADDSYRLIGGLIITIFFLTGAFLADIFTDKQYITSEIMHAIIGFLTGCVLMSGRGGHSNGNAPPVQPTQTQQPTQTKLKSFRRTE